MYNYHQMKLKLLVYDAIYIIRKGLERVLTNSFPNAEVFTAETFEQVVEYTKTIIFDIVIIDIKNYNVDNFFIIKQIKQNQPNTKILIFSEINEESYSIRCFKNGANGFINKNSTEENIRQAVTLLSVGNFYFLEGVKIRQFFSDKKRSWQKESVLESLSTREFQIAKMLSEGEPNISIASKLNLSMSSISTYKKRVLLKTNTHNILEIAELFKKDAHTAKR